MADAIIDFGRTQFDYKRVFSQLKFDIQDDWFPDPLGYEDIIDSNLLYDHIMANFDGHDGTYVAEERQLIDIPKPNFTLRYSLETNLPDRAIYHGLVERIQRHYETTISAFVLNHRKNNSSRSHRSMFASGVLAWKDFVSLVENSIDADSWLLTTDLANYFEHIDLAKLRRTLIRLLPRLSCTSQDKGELRSDIDILFSCLKNWSYDGKRGLPQNRDASSFLANIYMHSVDETMLKLGFKYYRYMDDIKVVTRSEEEARKALQILVGTLRELGLSINSKKTSIISSQDKDEIDSELDAGSSEVEYIDHLLKSGKRRDVWLGISELRRLTRALIEAGSYGDRPFRFCINRWIGLALCDDYDVPKENFSEINNAVIANFRNYPANTDQFVKYLRAVELTDAQVDQLINFVCNQEVNSYSWQLYRVWQLLGLKKVPISNDLVARAISLISSEQDTLERAGASFYLGVCGAPEHREKIASCFRSLDTFIGQRNALIAVHELPFGPIIKDTVAPFVLDSLKEVYRRHQTSKGEYYKPLERRPFSNIKYADSDYA